MKDTAQTSASDVELIDQGFFWKVFYGFLTLALLSACISFFGKQFGQSISMGGHTDDRTIHEIIVGNDVLKIAANELRFESARRNGELNSAEIYLKWPQMSGYSEENQDDFNHVNGSRNIVFLTFSGRMMSRDMTGRLEPIYKALIDKPGRPGPSGVTLYKFKEKSGYMNEVLAVAEDQGSVFVARCLTGDAASVSLAPCERDIHIGKNLSMTYRFSAALLKDWQNLDAALMAYAKKRVLTFGD